MKFDLFESQKIASDFILDNPHCALVIPMGLGKTLSTLYSIEMLKLIEKRYPTLVLTPAAIVDSVWPDEIELWGLDLTYTVLKGDKSKRERLIKKKTDIHICSYELLPWIALLPEFKRYRLLVLDELTRVKSTKSKTHKILHIVRPMFERVIGLTGTISSNHLTDIYGQIRIIAEDRIWKTKSQFLEMYFINVSKDKTLFPVYKIKSRSDEKRLFDKMSPVCLALSEKEHTDWPDVITKDIWFDLPPTLRDIYDEYEEEFLINITKEEIIESPNTGTRNHKLRQIISGFIYDKDKNAHDLSNHKMWVVREILDDLDESCLILYQFIHERECLLKSIPQSEAIMKQNTQEVKNKWNKRKLHRMIGYPKRMGYGLNLQKGGHHILWYSLTWSIEQYTQTIARLRRTGQSYPVTVIRPLYRDTIDEAVSKALKEKEATQERLYDHLIAYRDRRARRLR